VSIGGETHLCHCPSRYSNPTDGVVCFDHYWKNRVRREAYREEVLEIGLGERLIGKRFWR